MNTKNELRDELYRLIESHSSLRRIPITQAVSWLHAWSLARGLQYTERDVNEFIDGELEDCKIDIIIDYTSQKEADSLGVAAGDSIMFFRRLSENESARFKSLSKRTRALLKILRKQRNSPHLGIITIERAHRLLVEMGFSDNDKYITIPGVIHRAYVFDGDDMKIAYCITHEFMKTKEYEDHIDRLIDNTHQKRFTTLEMAREFAENEKYQRRRTNTKAKKNG